jgi:phage terminase large subunit-like protein
VSSSVAADPLAWIDHLPENERLALLREINQQLALFKLADYRPYPKQAEFHRAGGLLEIRERLLKAGNQLGKTLAAAFETAMHLTGQYPDWWDGALFDSHTAGWAGCDTGQNVRDGVQRLLLGPVGEWGTGAIPADAIADIKRASHGVPDQVETILVKHTNGRKSRVTLKTYDQGRIRWQGDTLDFVWFDEEPDLDIYTEGLTRTNATQGIVYLTFTPLKGMSETVKRFLIEKTPGTHVTSMSIYDAAHYTDAQRAAIIASYPAHEREARAMGTPMLGSGRIFPLPEDNLRENPVHLPYHWPRIAGIDFGWDHPTACVWLAWDRDTDTVHLYDAYRVKEATPVIHGAAIRARGEWIPVAWPHDGYQHDKGSGEALKDQYRKQKVNMLPEKATHAPEPGEPEGSGGNGVEAGLMEMLDRMQTGRLKVAAHLHDWWEEFRLYHREDGKVVKENDDLMSATRYALMMLRHAKVNAGQQRIPTVRSDFGTVPGMGPLG